jgi:hypothetical protein
MNPKSFTDEKSCTVESYIVPNFLTLKKFEFKIL